MNKYTVHYLENETLFIEEFQTSASANKRFQELKKKETVSSIYLVQVLTGGRLRARL
jgi:hypothetical protein